MLPKTFCGLLYGESRGGSSPESPVAQIPHWCKLVLWCVLLTVVVAGQLAALLYGFLHLGPEVHDASFGRGLLFGGLFLSLPLLTVPVGLAFPDTAATLLATWGVYQITWGDDHLLHARNVLFEVHVKLPAQAMGVDLHLEGRASYYCWAANGVILIFLARRILELLAQRRQARGEHESQVETHGQECEELEGEAVQPVEAHTVAPLLQQGGARAPLGPQLQEVLLPPRGLQERGLASQQRVVRCTATYTIEAEAHTPF